MKNGFSPKISLIELTLVENRIVNPMFSKINLDFTQLFINKIYRFYLAGKLSLSRQLFDFDICVFCLIIVSLFKRALSNVR